MATNKEGLKMENANRCMYCSESFSHYSSRVFPCDHIVCGKCLRNIDLKSDKVDCPVCKTSYSAINNIQTNLEKLTYVKQLEKIDNTHQELDKLATGSRGRPIRNTSKEDDDSPHCNHCRKNEAYSWCEDCKLNLCLSCTESHHIIPACKDHELHPRSEFVSKFTSDLDREMEKVRESLESLQDTRKCIDRILSEFKHLTMKQMSG